MPRKTRSCHRCGKEVWFGIFVNGWVYCLFCEAEVHETEYEKDEKKIRVTRKQADVLSQSFLKEMDSRMKEVLGPPLLDVTPKKILPKQFLGRKKGAQ